MKGRAQSTVQKYIVAPLDMKFHYLELEREIHSEGGPGTALCC